MAKILSVASWNVKHFGGKPSRVKSVVDFILKAENKPDIFALYEVKGSAVFQVMTNKMPNYQFYLTEGKQSQEILLGVKRSFTAFFSQRLEYKSDKPFLRPGALLTVTIDGENYSILFLHTKSGSEPLALGLRDDMFGTALKLKRRLDDVAGGKGKAKYLFLGDLNTMGMDYPYHPDITTDIELKRLNGRAKRSKMLVLSKTHTETWSGGSGSSYDDSNLDQVVASDQLKFKTFPNKDNNSSAASSKSPVDVRGWVDTSTTVKKDAWIKKYSDHCLLYFEIHS